MHVTKIQILKYLGLAQFKTGKLGKMNRITGDNGVGKTAILKAIKEAIKGSGVDPELVKVDMEKAEILIELDDRIEIQRTITQTANRVTVTDGGEPISKPQTFLDSLVGPFNFNPVDFFNANTKERRRILLSSMPFTITEKALREALGEFLDLAPLPAADYSQHGLVVLEQIRKQVYDHRQEVNRDVTRLKKAIEQDKKDMPDTVATDDRDIKELTAKVLEAKMASDEHEKNKATLESLRERSVSVKERIGRLEQEIVSLNEELDKIREAGKLTAATVEKYVAPDIKGLQAELDAYNDNQELLYKLKDIKRREEEIVSVELDHKALDDLHKALSNEVPKKMLAEVELPIEGLEIEGDKITVEGVAMDKLSTSEQMRFAVKLARKLAGKLKVICVDRYESLGGKAQKAFEEECASDEFEYFVTIVTDGDLKVESTDPVEKPKKKMGKAKPKQESTQTEAGF